VGKGKGGRKGLFTSLFCGKRKKKTKKIRKGGRGGLNTFFSEGKNFALRSGFSRGRLIRGDVEGRDEGKKGNPNSHLKRKTPPSEGKETRRPLLKERETRPHRSGGERRRKRKKRFFTTKRKERFIPIKKERVFQGKGKRNDLIAMGHAKRGGKKSVHKHTP